MNAYTKVLSQPIETLPPVLYMVKRSLQFINEPYVLMGNVHSTSNFLSKDLKTIHIPVYILHLNMVSVW